MKGEAQVSKKKRVYTSYKLRPCLLSKIFQNSPSHRILQHMHETLNINENKN